MSNKWPTDAPKQGVLKAMNRLGFEVVRIGNHISLLRNNPDGSKTSMTIPNHNEIKGSTLRRICSLAQISRDEFLDAYN